MCCQAAPLSSTAARLNMAPKEPLLGTLKGEQQHNSEGSMHLDLLWMQPSLALSPPIINSSLLEIVYPLGCLFPVRTVKSVMAMSPRSCVCGGERFQQPSGCWTHSTVRVSRNSVRPQPAVGWRRGDGRQPSSRLLL